MSIPNLNQDPALLQDVAAKGVEAFRASVMPWFGESLRQSVGDAVDDIADWYLTYRPDLLEEAISG